MEQITTNNRRQRTPSQVLSEYESVLRKYDISCIGPSARPLQDDSDNAFCDSGESGGGSSNESIHSANDNGFHHKNSQNTEQFNTVDIETMLTELFESVETVAKSKDSNEATLARLMKMIGTLVLRMPKAYYLNKLFRLCHISSQMTYLVTRCFCLMFEDSHFEPGETLMFPQPPLLPDQIDKSSLSLTSFEERAAGSFILDRGLKVFMSHGLTISTWVKLMSDRFDDQQHVISMGCKELKIIAEICPRSLSLRVTIHAEGAIILRKPFMNLLKVEQQWVNLVLAIQYSNDEIRAFIMCGNHHHAFTNRQRLVINSDTKMQVAVGSCLEEASSVSDQYAYRLSTVFGFKRILPAECGVMLRSLGSACFSLTECLLSQKYTSLIHCLGKPVITSKICNATDICDDSAVFLNKLQRCLLFTWRPSSATYYSLNILQKGVDYISFVDYNDSTLCLTMSKELPVFWFSTIIQERCDTIDKSIRTIGSMKLFLFLYALTVEMNASIETQAEAFHLLFVCLKRDPSYYEIFNEIDGSLILVQILSSRSARMNSNMCQDILMYAFTKLEHHNDGEELRVSPRTAIVAADFLRTILCCADIWKGYRFQYWSRIVSVISESVSDTIPDPYRTFNKRRLSHVQFLHQILLALLDMEMHLTHAAAAMDKSIYRSGGSTLSKGPQSPQVESTIAVAPMIKTLVSELISSPYKPTEITQLWDFLLLSHPAHDTYFDYSTRCHNEWMCEELLGLGDEPDVTGPFELSKYFEELLEEYGTNTVKRMWQESGQNIIRMRRRLLATDVNDQSKSSPPLPAERTRCDGGFRTCRMNSVSRPPSRPTQLADCERQAISMTDSIYSDSGLWLTETRAELLSVMADVVLDCDDELMGFLEKDVLYWQTILVLLSNQKHEKIRTCIFTLLKNLFLRCSPKYRQMFVSKQGFLILSNELKKSRVNDTIADALFSLTCGEHVSIRDGLDGAHLEDIQYDSFKIASFYALYALLEESTYDSSLFWSVCSTLQKIFIAVNAPRRSMFDSGLISALPNVLWRLCFSESSPPVDNPMFSLIDCWVAFAQSVIAYTIPFKNSENYNVCEDFLWLCVIAGYQGDVYLNLRDAALNSTGADTTGTMTRIEVGFDLAMNKELRRLDRPSLERGVRTFRKALCKMIYCWIDTIQTILTDQFQTKKGKFTPFMGAFEDESEDFEMIADEEQEHAWYLAADEYTQMKPKEFALSEDMAGRLLFGLSMAQNFFFYFLPPHYCSEYEETLFRYYIEIILSTWKRRQNEVRDDAKAPGVPEVEQLTDEWQSVLMFCREKSRVLLAKLIAFVFYPASTKLAEFTNFGGLPPASEETSDSLMLESPIGENIDGNASELPWALKRRLIIARHLARETVQDRYYMETLLDVNLDYQYAMKISLHELALLPSIVIRYNIDEYSTEIENLVKFLSRIQIESPLVKLTKEEISSIMSDELLLIHSYFNQKKEFCNEISAKAFMICETENALNKISTDTAMMLTCEIAELQNNPRRTFIFWRKDLMNDLARAGNTLENFSRELCHPQAAFFDASIWPLGWALETTENLCRERRRLAPCHYQFPLKFLQKAQRSLAEHLNFTRIPLHNILQSFKDHKSLDHAEAITQVRLSVSATLLRTAFECYGEIVVSDTKLYFLGEHAKSTQKGISYSPVTYSFAFDKIREIQIRCYLLKDIALEIFTTTGDAFLIIFSTTAERNTLIGQLQKMNLDHLFADHKGQLTAATEKWRKGAMTNFEYLMILNKLGGRSFNDLMQYPVFPFVLANYSQKMLDLNAISSFRDLSKPMAIQDAKMEQVYVQNYQSLMEEYRKLEEDAFSSVRMGAYHYGSHYSNTGIVAYYLVRVPPYTSVALEYQDNNFDIADRLFNVLETTWRLSSSESTTDFKELIPEFFFFPEMFSNRERLALGVRQGGQPVEDVELPPWCPRAGGGTKQNGDPRLFCFIHRQALESATVTSTLHLWIDLIFGFKQNGESAVKAINVFHPATYRGRDLEGEYNNDELSISAVRTMVRTYGQMPLTLFLSPHLPHLNNRKPSVSGNLALLPMLLSTSLGAANEDATRYPNHVFRTVEGLRWGEFYGSPEISSKHYQTPSYVYELDRNGERVNHLKVVYERDGTQSCYGLPARTELITYYKWDRKDVLRRNFEPMISAFLSWRFSDNVLRVKVFQKNENCWINLVDVQSLELTSVAFSASNESLFLGFKCGLIRVYSLQYRSDSVSFYRKWTIKLRSEMFAHEFPITFLQVSDDFHILVSTSAEGKICLWDTNRLQFVNVLTPPPAVDRGDEVITQCCVSPTTADICVCLQSGRGCRIVLFTVNGEVVGVREEPETVTSMTMTDMPEGLGINCIAVGFVNGVIRVLDMWTINVVYQFSYRGFTDPITSLAYSNESRRLHAVVAGFKVLRLQVPSLLVGSLKAPSFKSLNPFT